ncbi:hypothetical protein D3C71_1727520 [compost metagenome]
MHRINRRLRCIERRLAQFKHLTELELALEPVQRTQQILLFVAEITPQRVLRKQVRVPRLDSLQALRRIVGEARIEAEIRR